MALKRNITVAIDAALLKQARGVAARRGSSVSALLADELRELVASETEYAAAERKARAAHSLVSLTSRSTQREPSGSNAR